MKKIIFITDCTFPRGNPVANYIQYFMLATKMAGYKPILISDINYEFIPRDIDYINYKGLQIVPIKLSSNRIVRHFQYKYIILFNLPIKFRELKIDSEDIIFLYDKNKLLCSKMLSLRKSIRYKIIGGVAELFEKDDFSTNAAKKGTKRLDKIYKNYKYVLDKLYTQFDLIIPISTFINQYYQQKGMKTELIPIMADTHEFERREKSFEKYCFILPAHGKMKDDLESMLKAFAKLSDKQLAKIELHLCGGIKREHVKKIFFQEEYVRVESILIFHEWMKYDELIALYQKMHFLILARKTSQMTLANFPSKVPETMNFGIVPVVSDVGDYTKLYLRDGIDSIFIDGSSAQACYESICKAISLSKSEYMTYSENAIKCVKERFDYRVWVPKIKAMLDSLY